MQGRLVGRPSRDGQVFGWGWWDWWAFLAFDWWLGEVWQLRRDRFVDLGPAGAWQIAAKCASASICVFSVYGIG